MTRIVDSAPEWRTQGVGKGTVGWIKLYIKVNTT
jgi:hypothetical protein